MNVIAYREVHCLVKSKGSICLLKAVSVLFTGKQILPFGFTKQNTYPLACRLAYKYFKSRRQHHASRWFNWAGSLWRLRLLQACCQQHACRSRWLQKDLSHGMALPQIIVPPANKQQIGWWWAVSVCQRGQGGPADRMRRPDAAPTPRYADPAPQRRLYRGFSCMTLWDASLDESDGTCDIAGRRVFLITVNWRRV